MLINKRLSLFFETAEIFIMGNNNRNNNNRQQGQQGQQRQQPQQGQESTELELEEADMDAGDNLGTLQAAPLDQNSNGPDNNAGAGTASETAPTGDAVTGDVILANEEAPVPPTPENISQGEYVPPVQEDLAPTEPVDQAALLNTPAPTPTEVPPSLEVKKELGDDEASLVEDPAKVLAAEMVSADGTTVTLIMLRRLEKHMKFLRGKQGFRDKQEMFDEQVTWIDTVGNSLNLDYPQFVLVTKAILAEMLQDVDLFREGGAYRFLQSVKGKYPTNAIEGYEAYMTFLTRVAANWATRHRLRSSVDIAFPVSRLPTVKGKENLTKFFNSLVK